MSLPFLPIRKEEGKEGRKDGRERRRKKDRKEGELVLNLKS